MNVSKYTTGTLQVLITDGNNMKDANCVLISEGGEQIARCSAPFPFDTSWDERDANAHRLALAWNCHDQLVDMLRNAVRWHDQLTVGDVERMKAAIAKATPPDNRKGGMDAGAV